MARKFQFRRGGKTPLHLLEDQNENETLSTPSSKMSMADISRSVVVVAKKLVRVLRDFAAWSVFAGLAFALAVSMMTTQSPWNVVMGRPPEHNQQAVLVWNDEEQQNGVSAIISVSDDQTVLANQLTQQTGTVLRIDSKGDTVRSSSVVFKDYSLFVWADSRSSVWLHRGDKVIKKFNTDGSEAWSRRLNYWPEMAWSSSDGYILIAEQDENLGQYLRLYSPGGKEVWGDSSPFHLANGSVMDAAIAFDGKGIALAVLKLDNATPTSYGYLLDPTKRIIHEASLGTEVVRKAAISNDGSVAVVGNAFKLSVLRRDGSRQDLNLRSAMQTLAISPDGSLLAVASTIEPGYFLENNKTDIQVYSLAGVEATSAWSYQLRESLVAIMAGSDSVSVVTPQWVKAFTSTGEVAWGVESSFIGAEIRQALVSSSGQIVCIRDSRDCLTLWKGSMEVR